MSAKHWGALKEVSVFAHNFGAIYVFFFMHHICLAIINFNGPEVKQKWDNRLQRYHGIIYLFKYVRKVRYEKCWFHSTNFNLVEHIELIHVIGKLIPPNTMLPPVNSSSTPKGEGNFAIVMKVIVKAYSIHIFLAIIPPTKDQNKTFPAEQPILSTMQGFPSKTCSSNRRNLKC